MSEIWKVSYKSKNFWEQQFFFLFIFLESPHGCDEMRDLQIKVDEECESIERLRAFYETWLSGVVSHEKQELQKKSKIGLVS